MTYSPRLVFVTPASFRRPREPSLNAFVSQVATSWLLKGTIAPPAFDRHGRPPLGCWRHLDGRRKLPAPSLYIVLAISRRMSELGHKATFPGWGRVSALPLESGHPWF